MLVLPCVPLHAQGKLTSDPQALSVPVHDGYSADTWERKGNTGHTGTHSSPLVSQVPACTHTYTHPPTGSLECVKDVHTE